MAASSDPPTSAGVRPSIDRMAGVAFVLLLATAVAALLAFDWAPGVDVPAHLAMAEALAAQGSGNAVDVFFDVGTIPAPNALMMLVGALLSPWLPMSAIGVALFAAAVAMIVVGLGSLLAATDRPRFAALLALPFVLQWPLMEGLVDFSLGLGIVLQLGAVLVRWLAEPTRGRGVALAALSVLAFLAHVHAVLYVGLLTGLVGACWWLVAPRRADLPRVLKAFGLAVGPAALLVGAWLVAGESAGALADGSTHEVSFAARLKVLLDDGPLTLAGDGGAELVLWGLVALVVWRVLMRWPTPESLENVASDDRVGLAAERALRLFWLVCVAGVLFAPNNIGFYWSIHVRFVPMVWFIGLWWLVPRGFRPRVWRSWAGLRVFAGALIVVAVVIGTHAAWAKAGRTWDAWMAGFDRVLAAAPRETTALWLVEPKAAARATGFRLQPWRHLGQYHTAINDGLMTFSFGWHPGRLITEKVRREKFLERGNLASLERLDAFGCIEVVLQLGDFDLGAVAPLERLARHGNFAVWRRTTLCPGSAVSGVGGQGQRIESRAREL